VGSVGKLIGQDDFSLRSAVGTMKLCPPYSYFRPRFEQGTSQVYPMFPVWRLLSVWSYCTGI